MPTIKVNFDEVPDLLPLCLAFVCKSKPPVEALLVWEVVPPPKGRMWVDANIALGKADRRPTVAKRLSARPPSVQRKYLVLCREWPTSKEFDDCKMQLSELVEAVAVGVQGVWTEAEGDCIQSLLDIREFE
jgi:hypothetical protein